VTPQSPHRTRAIADKVVAFSISYERENLLQRGIGLEHLRELLIRMARPILRNGASIAYAGGWKDTEDNFTYPLLRLVSAEQEDNSLGGPDTSQQVGKLYNHCAWPHYLRITPRIEAQWISACRIVPISQKQAMIPDGEIVGDSDAQADSPRNAFNAAVTLSAMRRLAMQGITINVPDVPQPEPILPIAARVLIGGRTSGYSGFLPGIFEEALQALRCDRPLYILGGFGGATAVLADAVLGGPGRPDELSVDWHRQRTPGLARLLDNLGQFALPPDTKTTVAQLDELFTYLETARVGLSATLRTGLSDADTRELMTTRNASVALRLMRIGLQASIGLPARPD
jgi:hypothetical protein